jgi:hypothetical protein
MAASTPRLARPVGLLESYSTSRHNLGFYRCVALTARYSVDRSTLGNHDLQTAIEHAVAQTILAHPVLQVGIVGEEDTKPYFIHLEQLDLSKLIRSEPQFDGWSDRDAALQSLLEARHSSLWSHIHQRPGYEFIVFPPPVDSMSGSTMTVDIIFAFHHAYGDGNSGVILQRTLLHALNNPKPLSGFDTSTRILTIDTPAPLPPPQDGLIDFKISWSFLIKTLWEEFGPSFLKPAPPQPAWTGRAIATHPENTRLRLVSFAPPVASAIVKQCRTKSTTLTPLIHILVLRSLANRLPVPVLTNHSLASTTPISLRRLLPSGGKQGFDPEATMGVLLAGQEHRFSSTTIQKIRSSSDMDVLWDLTSSLGTDLRNKVASLPNDDITALLAWVSDWNERWTNMLGKERQYTWEVSNVGAADPQPAPRQEKRDWHMDRLVFSQSASVAGSAFSVSVAGVKGGELAIVLSWQDTIIEDELANGVASDLGEWLSYFAKTGRIGRKE